jgi:uncharacterized protein YwgA
MAAQQVTSWDRYALIAWIVSRLGRRDRPLGKKALQRIVHLIAELAGVRAGYRFRLYSYGPYSSDLESDLDAVRGFGGVEITKGHALLDGRLGRIERVLSTFGGHPAKDLALAAMIAYLWRHEPETFEDSERFADRVKMLNPQCSETAVKTAIDEVRVFVASAKGAGAAAFGCGHREDAP